MLNNTKDILTLKKLQELLHIGKNTALRLVQSGILSEPALTSAQILSPQCSQTTVSL